MELKGYLTSDGHIKKTFDEDVVIGELYYGEYSFGEDLVFYVELEHEDTSQVQNRQPLTTQVGWIVTLRDGRQITAETRDFALREAQRLWGTPEDPGES